MSKCLYILDSDDEQPLLPDNVIVVVWSQYALSTNEQYFSIPALIQQQDEALKKRLLAWLYELGEVSIVNKRIVDHLVIRPGFSYWWMTTLTGKHYAVSNVFYNTLRLFVLEQIILDVAPKKIIFQSADKQVSCVIQDYSQRANISFKWVKNKQKNAVARSWYQKLYHLLPYPLQSLVVGMHYIWQRRGARPNKQNEHTADITFVDYLAHLGPQAQESGVFSSNYWTSLVDLLKQNHIKTNWLHHYVTNGSVSSAKAGLALISRFNTTAAGLEQHRLMDAVLDFKIIGQVFLDYCKLAAQSIRLKKIARSFIPSQSNLDLWPLFKAEWQQSLRGPSVILNCFMLNVLEKNMRQLPQQTLGFYLQENLSWEMAFIYAWKKYGHGQLIGIVHATIRYWDLRYFYDPRCYERSIRNNLPLPDKVIVNGDLSLQMHVKGKYPIDALLQMEALRFLYLAKFLETKKNNNLVLRNEGRKRILILGDFVPVYSIQMLDWIAEVEKDCPSSFEYFYKPHPLCSVDTKKYPFITIVSGVLVDLLHNADLVFASNVTCAAVDAYCAGLPVVQLLSGKTMNMSPLYGLRGVYFATSALVLKNIFYSGLQSSFPDITSIFYYDNNLSKWASLFALQLMPSKKDRRGIEKKLLEEK